MEKLSYSESNIKQYVRKMVRSCVTSEIILADSEALSQHCMVLTVSNVLPGSDVQLGTNDYEKSFLLGL